MQKLYSVLKNVLTFERLNVTTIIVAVLLRFYQVPERFVFDIDTQYQALLASTIVKDFHIIWIGVSASNIGYYLGPGLTYLTAFLLWITKDPVILGYFASFVGSVTLVSIWHVSKKLFGEKVSFIATVLYGFTPFIINYDRKFWPIFVPLIGVWMLYGLVQSQKNKWWLLLCTFLISISFHIHLSLMIFWPFIIYVFFRSKVLMFKRSNVLFVLLNFAIYLFITSPLLVFDIVHNYDNLLAPVRFIQHLGKGALIVHREFPWTFLVSFLVSVYLWVRVKSFTEKILFGILIVISCAFIVYPGPMQEYYTVILFPFITIALALLTCKFPKPILVGGLLIYMSVNCYWYIAHSNPQGLVKKKESIQSICPSIQTKSYYLEVGQEGRDFGGWYYLFTAYCKRPARSDVDSMFGWIYQEELNNAPPQNTIVKIRSPH